MCKSRDKIYGIPIQLLKLIANTPFQVHFMGHVRGLPPMQRAIPFVEGELPRRGYLGPQGLQCAAGFGQHIIIEALDKHLVDASILNLKKDDDIM